MTIIIYSRVRLFGFVHETFENMDMEPWWCGGWLQHNESCWIVA